MRRDDVLSESFLHSFLRLTKNPSSKSSTERFREFIMEERRKTWQNQLPALYCMEFSVQKIPARIQ